MKKKIFYSIVCLLLLGLLGTFLVYCRNEEKQRIDANKQLRESMASVEQPVEQEVLRVEESRTEESNETADPVSEVLTESSAANDGVEDAQTTEASEKTPLISLRGDAFVEDAQIAEAGVGAHLMKHIEDANITAQVMDFTMYLAGSMAQLRLAGVDETKIESYLKRHTDNADNIELSLYETKVRAAEDMDLQREDQQGIPVICMGYYGGWYNDPDELNQQIQDILDTYAQQDKYVIAGLYPNVKVDKEAYTQKMTEAWGEHYLALDEVITHSPAQNNGREDIAKAVFEKLQSLGYLKAEE